MSAPKTEKGASAKLAKWAALDAQIAAIEATRNAAIAVANKIADDEMAPLLKQRDAIVPKVEPWWWEAGKALLKGKAKSMQLAGCMIGSRKDRDTLAIDGDETIVIGTLEKLAWAKPLLRYSVEIDKAAVLTSLDGVYKDKLAKLGLRRQVGADTFFVKRVAQGGTIAGATS
jgi:hypothetical protein